MSEEALVAIEDLRVAYETPGWRSTPKEILHGVSASVPRGKTLGLVGESGSGKSTLGRSLLGLAPITAGRISFDGRDVTRVSRKQRRTLSKDIQVVFQDPYTSLNPSMTVADILSEPLRVAGVGRAEAESRVRELLDQVGLPGNAGERMPREFSGGQRQRVAIARALALQPALIVCDEPVSALDLSTQAKVLDLFLELQEQFGISYLFISHDLSVVRHVCHEVSVMYRGQIVEHGPGERVTTAPEHEYTRRLMLAAPVADPRAQAERRRRRLNVLQTQ